MILTKETGARLGQEGHQEHIRTAGLPHSRFPEPAAFAAPQPREINSQNL